MKRQMIITKTPKATDLRKLRVAAYARVSTLSDEQEESYETQLAYYTNLIQSNPKWEFAGMYAEKKSGTKAYNRKEFQRLIADALDGKIDLIICKSISRWARNAVDSMETIRRLKGADVHLMFEQEGIDTRQPGSIFRINLYSAIAQAESESISENCKWTYRSRAQKGIYIPHKNTYYGYNTDDRTFKPDGNAKHVKFMFNQYLAGKGYTEIARMLNKQGVKTIRGNDWQAGGVESILTNEVYVGDVLIGKCPSRNIITGIIDEHQVTKYVKDHHPAIVDRQTWEKVQAKISASKEEKKMQKEAKKNVENKEEKDTKTA